MAAKSLRPRREPLFAKLLRQRQTLDLQFLEHLDGWSRTARQIFDQIAALPAVALVQLQSEPAKLRRKRQVNEKNMHDSARLLLYRLDHDGNAASATSLK